MSEFVSTHPPESPHPVLNNQRKWSTSLFAGCIYTGGLEEEDMGFLKTKLPLKWGWVKLAQQLLDGNYKSTSFLMGLLGTSAIPKKLDCRHIKLLEENFFKMVSLV